jgi:hypothetical protein
LHRYIKVRWEQKLRVLGRFTRDSLTDVPEQLSEDSPIFGITVPREGGEGVADASASGADAGDAASAAAAAAAAAAAGVGGGEGGAGKKKKSGKGKGGGGGGGGGNGDALVAPDGREWCPDEGDRALRLFIGAWQALYPTTDAAAENPGATAAVSAAVAPTENFLGERLLNWIYSDGGEGVWEYAHVDRDEARLRSQRDLKRLDDNCDVLQGLLSTKLMVRRQVDETLVLANRALTDYRTSGTLRALNPCIPADVVYFRETWTCMTCLRFQICDLRQTLLGLDLAELELEVGRRKLNSVETHSL